MEKVRIARLKRKFIRAKRNPDTGNPVYREEAQKNQDENENPDNTEAKITESLSLPTTYFNNL